MRVELLLLCASGCGRLLLQLWLSALCTFGLVRHVACASLLLRTLGARLLCCRGIRCCRVCAITAACLHTLHTRRGGFALCSVAQLAQHTVSVSCALRLHSEQSLAQAAPSSSRVGGESSGKESGHSDLWVGLELGS